MFWEAKETDKKAYKNAITNQLFIHASVRAYLETNTRSYLDNALASWKFRKSLILELCIGAHPGTVKERMRKQNGLYSECVSTSATLNG